MSEEFYVNPVERARRATLAKGAEAAVANALAKPVKPGKAQKPIRVPRKRSKLALVIVFGLAGLGGAGIAWSVREIEYNFSPKGQVDAAMAEKSATRCKGFDDGYRSRLRSILRATMKESLDAINKKDVAVCISRDMMKTEFLMAAYFPDSRTLVLRDDGEHYSRSNVASKPFVNAHAPDTINLLATHFDYISIRPEIAYASVYDAKTSPRIEWWYPVKKTNTDRVPSAEMR
mgnify:CR=1 FL=1